MNVRNLYYRLINSRGNIIASSNWEFRISAGCSNKLGVYCSFIIIWKFVYFVLFLSDTKVQRINAKKVYNLSDLKKIYSKKTCQVRLKRTNAMGFFSTNKLYFWWENKRNLIDYILWIHHLKKILKKSNKKLKTKITNVKNLIRRKQVS